MDVFKTIAGHVVAEIFEFLALAALAAQAHAGTGGAEEESGGRTIAQVGVDAHGLARVALAKRAPSM